MEGKTATKLMEHIEDAKDWLDKAKDEYNRKNSVKGDLILNLAQAEVKHAWELSRNCFVTNLDASQLSRQRKVNFLLPAAASLVFFLLAGTVFWFQAEKMSLASRKPVAALKSSSRITKLVTLPGETNLVKSINKSPDLQKVIPVEQSLVRTSNQDQSKAELAIADSKRQRKQVTAVTITNERPQREVIQNPINTRLESSLSIDEEALTKEASHSLRNGK